MATSYTSLLGLALPVQGELSGTWGDTVNNYISNYIDAAVAGAQTVTTNTTLTKTTGASLSGTSSQYAIIIASPASANITITAPAASKIYTIINTSATYTVKIVGAGPTTGVTLGVSEKAQVAWNGSDFVRIGASGGPGVFSSITNTGLTSGRVVYSTAGGLETDSANLLFNGTTLTANTLNLTNALGTTYGGTGLTSFTANGVVYASSSSALATGSALTFDGSTLETYSTVTARAASGTSAFRLRNTTSDYQWQTVAGTNAISLFDNAVGSARLTLDSSGNLGIGTSSPSKKLEVANSDALIYGITVGRGAGAVSTNTAVGVSVLGANTSGSLNTAIGYQAGLANTTAAGLTLVGHQAGVAATAGNLTGVGYQALVSNTSGIYNTALGQSALQANTTASNNTAVGYQAGYSNTTGTGLAALGYQAGYTNNGNGNTAIGGGNAFIGAALYANSSGGNNVAVGSGALTANTVSNNTAVGYGSATANTTGTFNVAVGTQALQANTTASNNTAVGYQAGYSNTGGTGITAFGYQAGYTHTSTSPNFADTFIGYRAGYLTTTGADVTFVGGFAGNSNTTGSFNVAVGGGALFFNTTASNNTAVGYMAGYSNQTSSGNTFIGIQAGYATTGARNTFVGDSAGTAVTTGARNTFIGGSNGASGSSGSLVTTGSANTILGNYNGNQGGLDIRTASNYIVLSDGDGNPRQIIDSSGNLGLGVTPSAWSGFRAMQIGGTTSLWSSTSGNASSFYTNNGYFNGSNRIYLTNGFASEYIMGSGSHYWFTAPSGTAGNAITFTQAMTLDASGNLGVGTTSPTSRLDVVSTGTGVAEFDGPANATVVFRGSGFAEGKIQCGGEFNFGSTNSYPVAFLTNGSERARIDTSGNLLVGTTTQVLSAKQTLSYGSGSNGLSIDCVDNVNATDFVIFRANGAVCGSVSRIGTTSAVAYVTTSDYRAKENIAPMTGALAKVLKLKPVTYDWKSGGSSQGFIAHELQAVVPDAVVGEKDAIDADGNPKYQGIDTSFLVATLTAAIQEQQATIQSLTDRIAQLEAQ